MYARPLNLPEPPEIAAYSGQTGANLLRVHALVSIQDIVNAEDLWRDLEESSTAPNCFFQSYAWCKSWAEHHGDERHQPVILMLTRNTKAIAILPLMQVMVRGGIKVMRALGEPHTQYTNLLTQNGSLDDAATDVLREALHSWPNIDAIFVQYVPELSPLQKVFGKLSEIPTLRNEASQYELKTFSSVEAFTKSLPVRRRQAQRRAASALQGDGPLLLEVIWPDDAKFTGALSQCLRWKDEWISNTGRMNAGINDKSHNVFLASIQSAAHKDGSVIFALKAGERPVAYQLGFIHHGHYHLYTASFEWRLRRWSLGTVLIDMTIGWLIENKIKIFDLMGNPAPYKGNWSNHSLILSAFMTSKTWRGKLYAHLWVKLLRPRLKNIYHHLPQAIRVQMLRLMPRSD